MTGIGKLIQWMHGMTDAVWERHTNPLSGWSRVATMPALAFAIWSRVWIGGGWSIAMVICLVVWIYFNPRLFPPPASTRNWISRGVLGERVWLNRATIPIPAHHAGAVRVLSVIAGLGLFPFAYGLWVLDPFAVLAGLAITMLGKLWFIDRMVWLYADMKPGHSAYAAWDR